MASTCVIFMSFPRLDGVMIKPGRHVQKARSAQDERMNRKASGATGCRHCPASHWPGILAPCVRTKSMMEESRPHKLPLWLLWSLASIVLWGVWGLVFKIASEGVDAYVNQLLYTVGLAPLM